MRGRKMNSRTDSMMLARDLLACAVLLREFELAKRINGYLIEEGVRRLGKFQGYREALDALVGDPGQIRFEEVTRFEQGIADQREVLARDIVTGVYLNYFGGDSGVHNKCKEGM